MSRITYTILMFTCLIPSAYAQQNGGKFRSVATPVPEHYIVVLTADAVAAAPGGVGDLAEILARRYQGIALFQYQHALLGFSARLSEQAARALSLEPSVAWVEEDGAVSASATQANPPLGLDRIDQRTLPLDSAYNYSITTGAHVYVLDTGIRVTHVDFGGRATGDYSAITDGWGANDCIAASDCTNNANGHGTHVAATIAGSTYGVAKGVRLHSVRVLDCSGTGLDSASHRGSRLGNREPPEPCGREHEPHGISIHES